MSCSADAATQQKPSDVCSTASAGHCALGGGGASAAPSQLPAVAGQYAGISGTAAINATLPKAGMGAAGTAVSGAAGQAYMTTAGVVANAGGTSASGIGGAAAIGGADAAALAGAGAGAGTGGNLAGVSSAELATLRQTCVDEINMYRATLPALNLMPLERASPEQEACSDKGAQQDGDSRMAHGSARMGLCYKVGLGAENTCPGWGVGGFSGNATLADALKGCLKSMWAEGEPPVSREMCVQDISGCFQAHGHYLNMSGTATAVACSFYEMSDGKYWMNQDFSQR